MRAPPILSFLALLVLVAALVSGAPRAEQAEDWPTRPITMVNAFPLGGLSDVVVRELNNELSVDFGQRVLLEARPGAGGAIASSYVAKMPPDGYTLLMTAVGPVVFRPLIDISAGYKDADFTPIILIGESPNILVANSKIGVNILKDFLAYAKTKTNKVSIGHAGPGTMGHLCSAMFSKLAGLDANLIPYRGTVQMLTDVFGGQIDLGFPAFNPIARSAKILAVTGDDPVDFLPGVPTLKQSGFDFSCMTWFAIYGPAHMPAEIAAKINGAMDAFLKKPENKARFAEQGIRLLGGPPKVLNERVAKDRAIWAPFISGLHLTPDK
jgi:tripartite-type tricarboxylate transporter receptor subunit TctC